MSSSIKENKMGFVPIGRLLISMSVPLMFSMLIQALYNVVDSIFVARLSESALTAVSLAFPLQNFMIALAVGTGVGVNALLSKSLGEKNMEEVSRMAEHGVFLAFCSYLLFLLIGLFGVRPFLVAQTNDPEILSYGCRYLQICCVFSVGVFGQIMFERLMQATGKTFYTMIVQAVGAIINIILDPILIFGLLGLPALGIDGAAIATVIGQILAMFLAIWLNHRKNPEVVLRLRNFRPQKRVVKQIYSIALPSIIMGSIASVMTYGINKILMGFTSTATAVFGVYFKLQSFIFMPVFGLNNGMIPIIGFNYGAGNRKRILKTYRLGLLYAVSIMAIGTVVFQIFPHLFLALFDASDTMIEIGVPSLRIISLSFVFAGFCIMTGTLIQALGKGFPSMVVSIVRQLVVLLPVAYLLSLSGNLNLVWLAFPIAEFASVILSIFFLYQTYQTILRHIPDGVQ